MSSVIANETGFDVINMGFSGTRAANHTNEHFNNFSLHEIVDAILSGNYSAQEVSAQATGIGMPSYFKTKVEALKKINFGEIDILRIGYGQNDWRGTVEIDNPEDPEDVSTYVGALRYSIRRMVEAYPNLKIILTTLMYCFQENGELDSDTWVAGKHKLTDFVDAMIELGKEFKIQVVDCYYRLGINKYNKLHYFSAKDGVHPLYRGRLLKGKHIALVL
ncbi:hypothetical protein ACFP65_10825 [Marinilactibacillus sp. GCM10026970]|uniref:hypothetical protein n=1 Tax=Marinilactibacillus sp. GCM10026970 TaxID=3252642 RepID=UPI0036069513